MRFKADKPVKPVCGLSNCYVDARTGARRLKMEIIKKSERISITRVLVQPNNEQPRHKHDTSEQIWIAVNGKGILLLADNKEEVFETGDVVRFADGDIHGLKNNSQDVFEYISVTSPPINFGYAYKNKK